MLTIGTWTIGALWRRPACSGTVSIFLSIFCCLQVLICYVVLRSDKEEKSDLKNYKIKAQNKKKKKEILSSIYSEWVDVNI